MKEHDERHIRITTLLSFVFDQGGAGKLITNVLGWCKCAMAAKEILRATAKEDEHFEL